MSVYEKVNDQKLFKRNIFSSKTFKYSVLSLSFFIINQPTFKYLLGLFTNFKHRHNIFIRQAYLNAALWTKTSVNKKRPPRNKTVHKI